MKTKHNTESYSDTSTYTEDMYNDWFVGDYDYEAGFPDELEYWICTCGHENQWTDRCEVCHAWYRERDAMWDD